MLVIIDIKDSAEYCPVCGAPCEDDGYGPEYAGNAYVTHCSCSRCGSEWDTRFQFAGNAVTHVSGDRYTGVTIRPTAGLQVVGDAGED